MLNDIHHRGTFSQLREKDARIAELAAELELITVLAAKGRDEISALTAEASKYREALKWIANGRDHTGLWLADIARSALKEG